MTKKAFEFSTILKDKVFRFAVRLLENTEDAQDVTQDVFEKLLKSHESFSKYENIEALSIKITRDLCIDGLRHKKVRRNILKGTTSQYNTPSGKQDYDDKDLADIVKQLINMLPDKQKMVIHLRDVEGYNYDEIAYMTGIEVSAVRMNLSRARKTVRDHMLKIINYGVQ